MVERDAYIDLVFRNGLKDLEVLPPQGVWENIEPSLSKIGKPLVWLRIAAGIAVIFSLGALTLYVGKQNNKELLSPSISLNKNLPMFDVTSVIQSPQILAKSSEIQGTSKTGNQLAHPEKATYLNYIVSSSEEILGEVDKNASSLAVAVVEMSAGDKSVPILGNKGFVINPSKWFKLAPSNDTKIKRWMLGALAAPTYYLKSNPNKVNLTTMLQNSEENLITYSGGLSFSYSINRKISIQSGLYYSAMANRVNGVDSYSGFLKFANTKSSSDFEVLTTNGSIIATNSNIFLTDNGGNRIATAYTIDVFDPAKANLEYITGSIRQNFEYLEIPIILRYKLLDKKIDINFLGGMSYNLLISNSAYAISGGRHILIGETEGINPLAFSSSLGLGLGYDFSDKLTFNIEPTLRYYLSKTSDRTDGKNHPYLLGIYSGIFYRF